MPAASHQNAARSSIRVCSEHGRPSSSSLVSVRPVSSHPPRLPPSPPARVASARCRPRRWTTPRRRRCAARWTTRRERTARPVSPRGRRRRASFSRAANNDPRPSRPPRPLAGDVLRVLRHPPRARRRRPSAPGPRGVRVREPPLVRPPHHPPRPRRVVSRARTFTSSPLSSSFAASDASSSVSLPPPRRAHPPRPPHATRPHPDRTPAPAPCS